MAEALGLGILSWRPLRGGVLSGKYVRDGAMPADSLRSGRLNRPTQRDWDVIDALAQVAAAIGASSAEVALAWVRNHPSVTAHRRSNSRAATRQPGLAGNHADLRAAQRPRRAIGSTPRLPRRHQRRARPMLGLGGTKVDGVELPVWPMLLSSSARY